MKDRSLARMRRRRAVSDPGTPGSRRASRVRSGISRRSTGRRTSFTDVTRAEELRDLTGLDVQRARRVPARAARAARAADPRDRRFFGSRRREDRGPRHQFPPRSCATILGAVRRARAWTRSRRLRRAAPASSRRDRRRASSPLLSRPPRRGRGRGAIAGVAPARALRARRRDAERPPIPAPAPRAPRSPRGKPRRAPAAMRCAGPRVARWRGSPPRCSCATAGSGATASTIAALATDLACNAYGSEVIGRAHRAAAAQGRRGSEPLRPAAAPGAAGRHEHQGRVGIGQEHAAPAAEAARRRTSASRWSEFALISPDIWRKQLLDYAHARRRPTSTAARSPARNCRSSTRSSTATWRARPSAAT